MLSLSSVNGARNKTPFSPRGVLDEILNLIELVSEGFPFYSSNCQSD